MTNKDIQINICFFFKRLLNEWNVLSSTLETLDLLFGGMRSWIVKLNLLPVFLQR